MKQPEDHPEAIALRLRADLAERGILGKAGRWRILGGGRTNLVWQIAGNGGSAPLICRLLRAGRGTPMFPNLPEAEIAAMQSLCGTGLAPRHVWSGLTVAGVCVVYREVGGDVWQGDAAPVARALAHLHRCRPAAGLRHVATTPLAALAQGAEMLPRLDPGLRATLTACRPLAKDAQTGPSVFLHGDPVPGNLIVSAGRVVLIDWQCPAWGDAIHDLSIFLSPGMQILGRGAPLTPTERSEFLGAYGDRAATARLAESDPALTWRMAVYCAWRMARGDTDYAPALEAELEHLNKLR